MILLLCVALVMLSIFSYCLNNNSFLSVSFMSAVSFLIAASTYLIFYSYIGSDISLSTVSIIVISLAAMLIGEALGRRIKIRNNVQKRKEYNILFVETKTKMVCWFVFMLFIFLIRFYDLYKYSISHGNSAGVLGVIANVRLSYALGEYSASSSIVSLAIYATLICEIVAYVYLYYYLYDFIFFGKVYKRLLLPLAGYIIVAISFTGRTQYIVIVTMIIWMSIFLYFKKDKQTSSHNNKKILKVMCTVGIIGIVALFGYGSFSRNLGGDTKLGETIIAYMGSAIYGFDTCKNINMHGIDAKLYGVGYYTFQNIHKFLNQFGMDIPVPTFHNLRFFYYEKGSSNIYTCFFFPYQDFGFWGTVLLRFFLGILCGLIEKKTIMQYAIDKKAIMWVIITGILYYDAISSYIADRYYDNLLDPTSILKYTIFSYLIIRLFCNAKKIRVYSEDTNE